MIPEPSECTIVAWFDGYDDLYAVAYRTDQHVEPGAETFRWYVVDNGASGDEPMTWPQLLEEMDALRGPVELISNGELSARGGF